MDLKLPALALVQGLPGWKKAKLKHSLHKKAHFLYRKLYEPKVKWWKKATSQK